MPEDKAIIAAAQCAIDALNRKYGGGFYLFTRERTLDEGRGKYSGFERKRGALLELAKLMCGDKSELNTRCGNAQLLRSARYILTLDGDTVPSPGSVRELIGAMLHPMNLPVLDRERGLVTAGHGIIPRPFLPILRAFSPEAADLSHTACSAARWAWIFSTAAVFPARA